MVRSGLFSFCAACQAVPGGVAGWVGRRCAPTALWCSVPRDGYPPILFQDVDRQGGRIVLRDTKNRSDHKLLLSRQAMGIVERNCLDKEPDDPLFAIVDTRFCRNGTPTGENAGTCLACQHVVYGCGKSASLAKSDRRCREALCAWLTSSTEPWVSGGCRRTQFVASATTWPEVAHASLRRVGRFRLRIYIRTDIVHQRKAVALVLGRNFQDGLQGLPGSRPKGHGCGALHRAAGANGGFGQTLEGPGPRGV